MKSDSRRTVAGPIRQCAVALALALPPAAAAQSLPLPITQQSSLFSRYPGDSEKSRLRDGIQEPAARRFLAAYESWRAGASVDTRELAQQFDAASASLALRDPGKVKAAYFPSANASLGLGAPPSDAGVQIKAAKARVLAVESSVDFGAGRDAGAVSAAPPGPRAPASALSTDLHARKSGPVAAEPPVPVTAANDETRIMSGKDVLMNVEIMGGLLAVTAVAMASAAAATGLAVFGGGVLVVAGGVKIARAVNSPGDPVDRTLEGAGGAAVIGGGLMAGAALVSLAAGAPLFVPLVVAGAVVMATAGAVALGAAAVGLWKARTHLKSAPAA